MLIKKETFVLVHLSTSNTYQDILYHYAPFQCLLESRGSFEATGKVYGLSSSTEGNSKESFAMLISRTLDWT